MSTITRRCWPSSRPEGLITRYSLDVAFEPEDLRKALVESGEGTVGNPVDQLVLWCFSFDPSSNSYVPQAWKIMRAGGAATVLLMLACMAALLVRPQARASSQTRVTDDPTESEPLRNRDRLTRFVATRFQETISDLTIETMIANFTSTMFFLGDYTESRFAWFPENASTFAHDVDWLFGFISVICILFFVPIAASLFYFAYKYHKPKGEKAESNATHNTPLELAWSILPSFFLVGMFIFGAKAYLDQRSVPDGANELGVQAFKWGWTFDYGGGTFNRELHLLVDEPTKLSMRSSDVIHSLFVPAFRAKKDVVPGRYNYMWFKPTVASEKVSPEELEQAITATEEGGGDWDYDRWQFTKDGYRFFDLYCAEYCGKDHSNMQTVVVVHETLEDLNAWIEEYSKRAPGVDPADYGKTLYEQRGCKGCHSIDGSKRVGPSFAESFGNLRPFASGESLVADENYIRESLMDPKAKVVAGYQPVMPSYKGQLSDDDIYSIVEYLKTVSEYAPKGDSASTTPDSAVSESVQ